MMLGVCMSKIIRLVILGWEIEVKVIPGIGEISGHRVITSELLYRCSLLER